MPNPPQSSPDRSSGRSSGHPSAAPTGVDAEVEELSRSLQASRRSLGAWYAAVHPVVVRLARGFLADRSAAEDVAQDVMLQLSDAIQQWDPARPFAAWSRTVVLNCCRNHQRAHARRVGHEEAAGEPWARGHAPSPEAAMEAGELSKLIDSALGVLPPREREVFVLIDLEGVPAPEVAEALELASSTVRASLSMARRRMRDALAPSLKPQGGEPR